MGGTVFMSLAGTIDRGDYTDGPRRVGQFSYGSGCCSEFYSGVVTQEGQDRQRQFNIKAELDKRWTMSMAEYDAMLLENAVVRFGTRNVSLDDHWNTIASKRTSDQPRLYLREIREFHRQYEWAA